MIAGLGLGTLYIIFVFVVLMCTLYTNSEKPGSASLQSPYNIVVGGNTMFYFYVTSTYSPALDGCLTVQLSIEFS